MLGIFSYILEGNYSVAIILILSRAFVVFCCLPIHEMAHAFVANKLGDKTAERQGRLTLNPFAHLDLIGTLMIFIFGIGYARAVPVNPNNFKKPKRDMALTALAGPVSNFLMAFVFNFIYCGIVYIGITSQLMSAIASFFYYAAIVNVTLAVFNLLPIPPLDGSKIFAALLPDKAYYKYMQYERYAMIAIFILLFTGILDGVISVLSSFLMSLISIIPNLIF